MVQARGSSDPGRRPDPLLLWEAGLALVLLVLFIVLYLLPAAQQPFRPHWFSGPLLAAGLFGLLVLNRWRRRRRRRAEMREAIHEVEVEAGLAEEEPRDEDAPPS